MNNSDRIIVNVTLSIMLMPVFYALYLAHVDFNMPFWDFVGLYAVGTGLAIILEQYH